MSVHSFSKNTQIMLNGRKIFQTVFTTIVYAVATEGCGLQGLCPHTAGEVASRSAHISSAALTDIGVCAVQEHNEGTQVSGRWAVTR